MVKQNTLRALHCLRDTTRENPVGSRWFAERAWPKDDPRYAANWSRVSNIGHGSTKGVGMWRAAGSFLASMARLGLVADANAAKSGTLPAYYITVKGLRTLERGAYDPNRPARLGDAVDTRQHVRLRKELRTTGGDVFKAGTLFTISNHWRGRLNLDQVGVRKGAAGTIRRVRLRDVEFLPAEATAKAAGALAASDRMACVLQNPARLGRS